MHRRGHALPPHRDRRGQTSLRGARERARREGARGRRLGALMVQQCRRASLRGGPARPLRALRLRGPRLMTPLLRLASSHQPGVELLGQRGHGQRRAAPELQGRREDPLRRRHLEGLPPGALRGRGSPGGGAEAPALPEPRGRRGSHRRGRQAPRPTEVAREPARQGHVVRVQAEMRRRPRLPMALAPRIVTI